SAWIDIVKICDPKLAEAAARPFYSAWPSNSSKPNLSHFAGRKMGELRNANCHILSAGTASPCKIKLLSLMPPPNLLLRSNEKYPPIGTFTPLDLFWKEYSDHINASAFQLPIPRRPQFWILIYKLI